MSAIDLAVIGGTGLYDFRGLERVEKRTVETPFGAASDAITIGELAGKRVAFAQCVAPFAGAADFARRHRSGRGAGAGSSGARRLALSPAFA